MVSSFVYCWEIRLAHLRSQNKQQERAANIAALPSTYSEALSSEDRIILGKPVEDLVQDVRNRVFRPIDILRTYGKLAIRAHEKTNCLTEVMISTAESWAEDANLKGPLAGIPVSLKDTVVVGGFDVSIGYSSTTGKPAAQDGTLARILRDAGQNCFMIVG